MPGWSPEHALAASGHGRDLKYRRATMLDRSPLYSLRPIQLPDAPAVAALIHAAFAILPVAPDPPMSALLVTAEDIAAHLGYGSGAVAQAEGQLVGSALWAEKDGGLYLSRIAVAPPWRRGGIARALIAAAETAAMQAGLPRLHLSTRLVLAGNRALFAACGFVETKQHAHAGYAAPTYVDMEKWLDPAAAAVSPADR